MAQELPWCRVDLTDAEWRDLWTSVEGGEWSDEDWAVIEHAQARDGLIGWEGRVKSAVERILLARMAEAYEDGWLDRNVAGDRDVLSNPYKED